MISRIIKLDRSVGALLILLMASLCATAQSGPRPASVKVDSKTGTITGRVVNENGLPHVNIEVSVRPDTPEGIPVTRTTTNREGSFKFNGLEPRLYVVSAALPAHMPKSLYPSPVIYKDSEVVTLVLIKGGVVTGTVTDGKGDPIVGIGVRVRMVGDETGRRYADGGLYFDNMTDDRGVYRVYGVPTGTYVVSADGSIEDRTSSFWFLRVRAFSNDLPTYAPSSNREGANEISVRAGEEVSDVNIRYRRERGSTISGIVNGTYDERRMSVTLSSILDRGPRWYNQVRAAGREFIFEAIPDGEYYLAASASSSDGKGQQSESMVLSVRGADREGIELTLFPAASIKGVVVFKPLSNPPPECGQPQPQLSQTSVTAWQRLTEGSSKKSHSVVSAGRPATLNSEGKFTLSDLAAGEYHFGVRFSSEEWYLQSIAFAPPTPGGIPTDAMNTWTNVKPGDQLSDLTFTLAQGAGMVSGEVLPGLTHPEKMVAVVVPAELAKAGDALRYYAVPVNSDGRFWMRVAPGRYWLMVREGSENTQREMSKLRLPDGAESRAALRRAAEETKAEIEVKPCQDFPAKLPL